MGVFSSKCSSSVRLDGKTAVVTGSNTGIGRATAKDFYQRGATVVMACRDTLKAEDAARAIREETSEDTCVGRLRVVRLDLASLASVRQCAEQLLKEEQAIHLLINNAGVMACPKSYTEDGFEMQLGVNHLGHFLFTCLLLPRIIRSAPSRIINVSSLVHYGGNINFDDINSEKSYNSVGAYAQSKLANVLFTKELATRLEGSQVTTYSLHPGVIATELGRHFGTGIFPGFTWLFDNIACYFIKTPLQGAQTTIYCAVSEDTAKESGLYYSECQKRTPSRKARDPKIAKQLWDVSTKLVNLEDWDPFTAR